MDVAIHSIHFDADQKLINFIQKKVNKLDSFYDGFTSGEVFLRLSNNNNYENKVAELRLHMPGKEIFARKQSKSFEESTDSAIEALRRQVKRHKEKMAIA